MPTSFVINSSGKAEIIKDPHAILDYSWDWNEWLSASNPDDTISSHQIIITNSATAVVDSSSVASGIVTAWIRGGAVGDKIAATCRITTSAGRTDDRTVYLKVKER